MSWSPSPKVAVARDAAHKLGADVGAIIIYLTPTQVGMASYGRNKRLCEEMGKLGEHLLACVNSYYEETP